MGFSNDGNRLVSGAYDKTLILWQREDAGEAFQPVKTLKKHTAEVLCAAFSPDGQHIVSGSFDNQLLLWDGRTGGRKAFCSAKSRRAC